MNGREEKMRIGRKAGIVAGAALAGLAVAAYAASRQGECKLREAGPFDKDKAVKVEVGEKLQAVCSFYISDFFKKKIINAGVKVKNPTKKPVFFHYYVAFFDKDGKLLGCAAQGSFGDEGLAPGKETQMGSCLIPLPAAKFAEVKSYQVAFYESDKPVGKQ
jgi:hypothetical protein